MATLLPPVVTPSSTNSQQHRGLIASSLNAVIRWLAGFVMANITDYATGTWTPIDASGAGLTLTVDAASYTKIGNFVFVTGTLSYPTTSNGSFATIGGLPFTTANQLGVGGVFLVYYGASPSLLGFLAQNANTFTVRNMAGSSTVNSVISACTLRFQFFYPTS